MSDVMRTKFRKRELREAETSEITVRSLFATLAL